MGIPITAGVVSHFQLLTSSFSLPASHFQLLTSGFSLLAFPLNCSALCLKRRTASIPGLDKRNSLSCKIADDIRDDLNDDRVLKGCETVRATTTDVRSTVDVEISVTMETR
jgi:hypothetical protein